MPGPRPRPCPADAALRVDEQPREPSWARPVKLAHFLSLSSYAGFGRGFD